MKHKGNKQQELPKMQTACDLVGAIIFENKFCINILINRSK